MKNKPKKHPLFHGIKLKLGWWYCEGCQKYHGPRTVAYQRLSLFSDKIFCSLHRENRGL